MADPIKRVNYFDHQFLHADDFIDEQKYHIRLRRLHNAALHTWGIARGLDLSFITGESRATVSEGVAVDGNGREIVLAESKLTPDLSGNKNKTVYITIAYSEKETDSTTETGVSGETRLTEEPEIRVAEDPPDDPSQELILGRLTLDKNAKITMKDEGEEPNKRRLAGVIGGDLEVRRLRLSLPDAADSQWPALSCSAANQVDLTGDLSISGQVGIGTASPQSPLAVLGGAAIGSDYADKKAPDNGLLVEGNVGIGTTEPKSPLSVSGGAAIGADYATKTAPANGLIVQGNVGIGTTSPEATLDIRGTLKANVTTVGLMFRGEEKNYVEIPEMNPDYRNGFTVEAWVRYRSTQLWSRIIDFGNGADKDNIFLANSETTTDLWFEVHRDGEKLAVTAAGALETGTWMHLAATVDRSGQATLYKNGQLLVIGSVLVPATLNRTKNHIGRSNWEDDRYFDGKIAEVAIWNRARTEAEINHDMNTKLSGSEDGLVGYWPCDEGAGKQVKDKALEQHHGTIHGATWFQEDIPAITIARYGNVGIGTKEPKSPLSVTGNIGLGPNASLYAPGGVENLYLIRGTVALNGSTLEGQGFKVEHSATGLYNITFSPAFSAKPTVVVTQQHPEKDDFTDGGGNTRDNCVVVAVSEEVCRIKCGDGDGKAADRRFHFVALGPR